MVAKEKKGPLNLKHRKPMMTEKITANPAPANMPSQGDIFHEIKSRVEVYAPTPKNAACPTENCPAYPPRMFQASLNTAKNRIRISTCIT
jgi:hypothetical protein